MEQPAPDFERQISGVRLGATRYPNYDRAVRGIAGYWDPVMQSRSLRERKPRALQLFGDAIVFFRERGTVYALRDR